MKKEVIILIAEPDEKYSELIRKNLWRAGISNKMLNFADGPDTLDFLSKVSERSKRVQNYQEYVLLLDSQLPRINGIEVLEKIRQDVDLKMIPVIVLAQIDQRDTIEQFYELGCSTYIVKPAADEEFEEIIQKIGHFLSVVEITSNG